MRLTLLEKADPDPYALAALSRILRANAALPLLRGKDGVKWKLGSAGDAKMELLRKLHHLNIHDLSRLRSNVSFQQDADATLLLDALVPPNSRALITGNKKAFEKLTVPYF